MPLGGHLGVSVPAGKQLLDLASVFRYPLLLTTNTDNQVTDLWQMLFEIEVHVGVY